MLHFDRVEEILERSQPAARELSERLQEVIAERFQESGKSQAHY